MIKNKLNFESEKLQVDWIGFTIKDITLSEMENISLYLFDNFNFNVSKKIKGSDTDKKIFWKDENSHSCYFLIVDSKDSKGYWKNDFWQGIILVFSGKNAHHFFEILKTKDFDFDIFDLNRTNLTRIDVNHTVEVPDTKYGLEDFFNSISEKLTIDNRSFSYTIDTGTGFRLLTIGNRASNRYYRIYERNNGLRFEFEMKKALVKSFQSDLFSKNLKTLEENISNEFFNHSNNILVLHSFYTNWLVDYNRNLRINNSKLVNAPFMTTFLKDSRSLSYNDENASNLFELFRVVSFLYTMDKSNLEIKYLACTPYYDLTFPLKDYLEFLGYENSKYRRRELKLFLDMLHKIPQHHRIVCEIPDLSYRSFVIFPGVIVKRLTNDSPWMVFMSVSKEFCEYSYQFIFPLEFLKINDKHDKIIKLHLLHVICSVDIQKQFDVQTFLDNYPISPNRKKGISDKTASLLMELKQTKWLSSKFHLVDKQGERDTKEKLVGSDLLKLKYIYLFEE